MSWDSGAPAIVMGLRMRIAVERMEPVHFCCEMVRGVNVRDGLPYFFGGRRAGCFEKRNRHAVFDESHLYDVLCRMCKRCRKAR